MSGVGDQWLELTRDPTETTWPNTHDFGPAQQSTMVCTRCLLVLTFADLFHLDTLNPECPGEPRQVAEETA